MTKEEKQTITKDLLPRLQYGVKAQIIGCHDEIVYGGYEAEVEDTSDEALHLNEDTFQNISLFLNDEEVTSIKTYLRPMSSMTLEERAEYDKYINGHISVEHHIKEIDWLNAHHFDYRGLIGKGLALEAPEDMYEF